MEEQPATQPNVEATVAEILKKVQEFSTIRLESRMYPHPLDEDLKTFIDLWCQFPEAKRKEITEGLTDDKQRTRLFQFSHRRAREATEATDKESKLRAVRYGILALVVEGVRKDSQSTFLALQLFFGLVRPSRLVAPIYDEAYALAEGPAKEFFARFAITGSEKKDS